MVSFGEDDTAGEPSAVDRRGLPNDSFSIQASTRISLDAALLQPERVDREFPREHLEH